MCAASTRWINYDISAVGASGDGRSAGGKGTRGSSVGTGTVSADGISIGPTTNRLYIQMDGETPTPSYITLYSGSSLDPRFVARDITEKLHNVNTGDERWANSTCDWMNGPWGNGSGDTHRFRIYAGTLGSAAGVTVALSGTNSAHNVLGFDSKYEAGGSVNNSTGGANVSDATLTVSGTYYGFFDEIYKIVVSNDNNGGSTRGIATPTKDGSNTYAGTISTGGLFNYTTDLLYTIAIDVTNGTTMGAGTGNVPLMSWISDGVADDSDTATELLYPTHWYKVGSYGLMVKFTDAVFNTASPAWTIQCSYPQYV